MSISFKLDSNNNIINNSNFILIYNKDALVQDIKTRLYMYKGEYPFNTNQGIDYIDYMRSGDEKGLLADIQKRILEDDRIRNVSFDVSQDSDVLKIILTLMTGEEVSFELD